MKVTIHQPDFMPWLGFFNKINKADIFVVLDHTENNPRDSSFWGRRVQILTNGNANWFSLPLSKPKSGILGVPINEMSINFSSEKEIKKKISTIKQNYSKHPFFEDIFPLIQEYFNYPSNSLLDRNMNFINKIIKELLIDTEIVFSSKLFCKNKSNELLIEIVNKVGGDIYLCGDGASGYQQDNLFEKNNIIIEYNNFTSPNYEQMKSSCFVPGLSILDSLMNLGYSGVRKIL